MSSPPRPGRSHMPRLLTAIAMLAMLVLSGLPASALSTTPAPQRQPSPTATITVSPSATPAATPIPGPDNSTPAATPPAIGAPSTSPPAVEPTDPAAFAAQFAAVDLVLADVHVDIGVRLIDGQLRMQIKDGTDVATPVWRELSTTMYHALPAAAITVPEDPAYAFLGPAGSSTFVLPQVQQTGLLWPGWNTEEITTAQVSGPVTWTVHGVQGPGRFALFTTNSFGAPSVLFNSDDGLPDRVDVPLGTHAHGNWAFSAAGLYNLDIEMAVTTAAGTRLTDREALLVAVGDVDPLALARQQESATSPPAGGGGTGTGSGSGTSGSGTGTSGGGSGTSGSGTGTGSGSGTSGSGSTTQPSTQTAALPSTGGGATSTMVGIGLLGIAAGLRHASRRPDERSPETTEDLR